MKIGILFGGKSNEHEVSVASATSIISNLNKEKYEIIPIYLNKRNEFYLWKEKIDKINPSSVGFLPAKIEKIKNPFEYLKTFDTIFIMIHGATGEDGTIAHILDFLEVAYIGNKPDPSIITMDKIITKEILEKNKIKTSPYLAFSKYNNEYIIEGRVVSKKELYELINKKLIYPLFVKPARSGSSIGITKVLEKKELDRAINNALKIDNRILIEEEVFGRELECGILEQDHDLIASVVGEIKSAEDFYSYNAKYENKNSKTMIPANIDSKISKKIKEEAIKVFKTLNCHGYSRCDFFLTHDSKIILNEINTIPGFTEISMYPRLFETIGISYPELLDILIEESIK